MFSTHDGSVPVPDSVLAAIHRLIEAANKSDLPIIDVSETAATLAATLPEASALDLERLRDAIAQIASRDSRVGISFNRAA